MCRTWLNPCLVSVLAVWACGATADASKADNGRSASVVPLGEIECSPNRKAGEPFDPPSTSAIPQTEAFVAQEHFREDITPAAQVKISWLGATFVRRFAVKVETARDTSLQSYTLRTPSSATEITGDLGIRDETRLADVWCLLRLQGKGESGALEINSSPNIFFVRDAIGELGVVDALWGGAGWEIGASPIASQQTWLRGTRVFSR